MIIISAMSEDRIIGSSDGMPWNVPEEYEQYLRFVSGNTVVMGRKTFDRFGSDLPSSTTIIVISRGNQLANVSVVSSLDDALILAESFGKPVFVAGGGSIYRLALPLANEMYLSTIKGQYKGDTHFPAFAAEEWNVTEERHESEFVFRKYRRRTIAKT